MTNNDTCTAHGGRAGGGALTLLAALTETINHSLCRPKMICFKGAWRGAVNDIINSLRSRAHKMVRFYFVSFLSFMKKKTD